MLLSRNPQELDDKYADKKRSDLRDELNELQRLCIEENIPVLIIIEGFESSGKGYVMNELTRDLDTKYYRVKVFDDLGEASEYDYIKKLWSSIPPYGNFHIQYRSMYTVLFNDLSSKNEATRLRLEQVKRTEHLLYSDHHIILKFFLDIDRKTQKKNIQGLQDDKYRSFFVTEMDANQLEHYDNYRKNISEILTETNFEYAPWHVVTAFDNKEASRYILGATVDHIKKEIEDIRQLRKEEAKYRYVQKKVDKSIKRLDLSKTLNDEDYNKILSVLQDRAGELAYQLYNEKIPTVIVFEGIDAAGKGGSIRRLLRKIDPRIYDVNPTSAPSDLEKKHHYLWRFYNNLPKPGEIALFDRSWYGRILVERIEGFANEYEWARAYQEINNMEKELTDFGVLVLKYHLVISKDEQERRFKEREENKPYKITDEDWRNREEWDNYIVAMDEMLQKTHTDYAPWHVISSEDKNYARVEVLKDFIARAELKLEEHEEDKLLIKRREKIAKESDKKD